MMLWSNDRVEEVSERGFNLVNPAFYYVNRLIVTDIRDEYEEALAKQAAEIERLSADNAELLHLRDMEHGRHQLAQQEIERLRQAQFTAWELSELHRMVEGEASRIEADTNRGGGIDDPRLTKWNALSLKLAEMAKVQP